MRAPVEMVLTGPTCRRERRTVASWQRTAARRAELVRLGLGALHEVDGRVVAVLGSGGAR